MINQCDFCKKKSLKKASIRKHEAICFHNPASRSCATCLWFTLSSEFSQIGRYDEEICRIGEIKDGPEVRSKLRTQCEKWMGTKIYFEKETTNNEDEMEKNLLAGNEEYFKNL